MKKVMELKEEFIYNTFYHKVGNFKLKTLGIGNECSSLRIQESLCNYDGIVGSWWLPFAGGCHVSRETLMCGASIMGSLRHSALIFLWQLFSCQYCLRAKLMELTGQIK